MSLPPLHPRSLPPQEAWECVQSPITKEIAHDILSDPLLHYLIPAVITISPSRDDTHIYSLSKIKNTGIDIGTVLAFPHLVECRYYISLVSEEEADKILSSNNLREAYFILSETSTLTTYLIDLIRDIADDGRDYHYRVLNCAEGTNGDIVYGVDLHHGSIKFIGENYLPDNLCKLCKLCKLRELRKYILIAFQETEVETIIDDCGDLDSPDEEERKAMGNYLHLLNDSKISSDISGRDDSL